MLDQPEREYMPDNLVGLKVASNIINVRPTVVDDARSAAVVIAMWDFELGQLRASDNSEGVCHAMACHDKEILPGIVSALGLLMEKYSDFFGAINIQTQPGSWRLEFLTSWAHPRIVNDERNSRGLLSSLLKEGLGYVPEFGKIAIRHNTPQDPQEEDPQDMD
jgi:hypothetical protein